MFIFLPFFWPHPQPTDSSLVWVIVAAAIIILILIVVILILIFALRRQRQANSTPEAGTTSESDIVTQVSARQTNPADDSTLPSTNGPALAVAGDEPTAPSAAVREADLAATQPSISTSHIVEAATTLPISEQRPAAIGWQIAGLTHVGMKRAGNEDKFIMLESDMKNGSACGLYVVADGMGGHESGEVASALTIETVQSHFAQTPLGQPPYEDWLKSTVDAANAAVISHQADKNIEKKMGSTLVMALVAEGQAHIASVGDSRAYHLNSDSITQISVDHSLVERLIQIGQITREEARTHKQRNVIYSTIGDSKAKLQVGLYHIDWQPGDRLLLCSDGLSGMLTDEQMFNISRSHESAADACQTLIKAANSAGGTDNITAIIVEMHV